MSALRWATLARAGALLVLALVLTGLVAACGGDDDDDSSGAAATSGSTGAATATHSSSGAEATATTAPGGAATATTGASSEATGTSVTSTEATPTEAEEATPTEAAAEDTPTEATTGNDEDPLADYKPIDPDQLPNFSADATYSFENLSTDTPSGTVTIEIQQSAVDNFHQKIVSEDTTVEIWGDGDNVWFSDGTQVQQLPAGMDTSLYSPSAALAQVPEVADKSGAEKVGEEKVSGRKTTHYRMSPEKFLELVSEGSDYLQGASNADGNADFWIDNELKIIIKADIDVTWSNTDGTNGSMKEQYLISDIGSTARVEPPQ